MTPILVIIFGFKPTVARRTSAKPLPAADYDSDNAPS
jgi:hypothetical protein